MLWKRVRPTQIMLREVQLLRVVPGSSSVEDAIVTDESLEAGNVVVSLYPVGW